jgi:release factor glutamine methyltransferase
VTGANAVLVGELVAAGVEPREARWLIEEFFVGDDPDALASLHAAADRRLGGEPLQYVIGHWPFRSLDLDLDPRVLIPRPETEELVEAALGELVALDVNAPMILDLGCGSGAIGLALLDELGGRGVMATLLAVDASPDALAVARRNALKHDLRAVSFVQSSWFDAVDESLRGRIDLIVANPPYVGEDEFVQLDPVLGYEPRVALVAADASGVAGFSNVETIIKESPAWLSPAGVLVCEHGNEHGAAALAAALSAGFSSVDDLSDLAGQPRVLIARR